MNIEDTRGVKNAKEHKKGFSGKTKID